MVDENRKELITNRIFSKIMDLGYNSIICNAICHIEMVKLNKYFTDEELIDVIGCANRCVELNSYVNDRWHDLTQTEKYEIILNDVSHHVSIGIFADSPSYSE